jgi:hypothetical protein
MWQYVCEHPYRSVYVALLSVWFINLLVVCLRTFYVDNYLYKPANRACARAIFDNDLPAARMAFDAMKDANAKLIGPFWFVRFFRRRVAMTAMPTMRRDRGWRAPRTRWQRMRLSFTVWWSLLRRRFRG